MTSNNIIISSLTNTIVPNILPSRRLWTKHVRSSIVFTNKNKYLLSIVCNIYIPLHSFDYLQKISIKINVVRDEGNSRNETWHRANDEIGVAVQSWLWVKVELMAWQLSRLEHLNGIQWSWVQILLRLTFYSYFKEPFSGIYGIHHWRIL